MSEPAHDHILRHPKELTIDLVKGVVGRTLVNVYGPSPDPGHRILRGYCVLRDSYPDTAVRWRTFIGESAPEYPWHGVDFHQSDTFSPDELFEAVTHIWETFK